ncbi:unnamed protein product [Tilletia controversa]|nr:unnamed protein product [Tilletia controversa]CAD6911849.1 unnamed protein product [Tilletia controversa]CAD6985693.1 unnamed protein product [Tilletia controversa]
MDPSNKPEPTKVGLNAPPAGATKPDPLGGGYTINKDSISVGAGIGVNGVSKFFPLDVAKNGSIVASVFGRMLKCVVEGKKATCTS